MPRASRARWRRSRRRRPGCDRESGERRQRRLESPRSSLRDQHGRESSEFPHCMNESSHLRLGRMSSSGCSGASLTQGQRGLPRAGLLPQKALPGDCILDRAGKRAPRLPLPRGQRFRLLRQGAAARRRRVPDELHRHTNQKRVSAGSTQFTTSGLGLTRENGTSGAKTVLAVASPTRPNRHRLDRRSPPAGDGG